jgi:hypothetical protein
VRGWSLERRPRHFRGSPNAALHCATRPTPVLRYRKRVKSRRAAIFRPAGLPFGSCLRSRLRRSPNQSAFPTRRSSPLRSQRTPRPPFVSFQRLDPPQGYGGRVVSIYYLEPKQSPSVASVFSVAGPAPHPSSGTKAAAPFVSFVSFCYFVSPPFQPRQSGLQKVTKATKSLPPRFKIKPKTIRGIQ